MIIYPIISATPDCTPPIRIVHLNHVKGHYYNNYNVLLLIFTINYNITVYNYATHARAVMNEILISKKCRNIN